MCIKNVLNNTILWEQFKPINLFKVYQLLINMEIKSFNSIFYNIIGEYLNKHFENIKYSKYNWTGLKKM